MTDDAKVLTALIRVAAARSRLRLAEIEEVGVLLSSGRISEAGALHLLWQIDATDLVLGTVGKKNDRGDVEAQRSETLMKATVSEFGDRSGPGIWSVLIATMPTALIAQMKMTVSKFRQRSLTTQMVEFDHQQSGCRHEQAQYARDCRRAEERRS